jgi:hypothetical protein
MRRMLTSTVTAAGVAAALFGAVPCYAAYQYHPTSSWASRTYAPRTYAPRTWASRTWASRTYNTRMWNH